MQELANRRLSNYRNYIVLIWVLMISFMGTTTTTTTLAAGAGAGATSHADAGNGTKTKTKTKTKTETEIGVDVGVILNLQETQGKMLNICISMALHDFYQTHPNYTTRILPHFRDAQDDNVQAASAAIDLLKNVGVMAIIGPQKSSQADFVIEIANKSKVPVISWATSPALSPKDNHYFVRAAHSASSQAQPIAALIKRFGWREVVFVYEQGDFGSGPLPYLSDAMLDVGAQVKFRSVVSPSASGVEILQQLYQLKTMQTRVFIVHMLPDLASRFFRKAHEAGMMEEGYAWIITDVLTSLLHSVDPSALSCMQGVLGMKPHIPRSNELIDLEKRWKRRFRAENINPELEAVGQLDVFGIWSYDAVFALAMALERVITSTSTANWNFQQPPEAAATDLGAIGTSEMGSNLIPWIRNVAFRGVSHDFHIVDGQLQSWAYQIVNVIGNGEKAIGFWTHQNAGISRSLIWSGSGSGKGKNDHVGLGAITWPGDTHKVPKGWEIPTSSDKKLRVGVPAKGGFVQFINVTVDPETRAVSATGFCAEVFEQVMKALDYAVPIEYIPFETTSRSYNDLVYQIFQNEYDAVVGDITILANRSNYVDFTLPYTESGVRMVVAIKADETRNAWVFMKPLEMRLWLTIAAFFIYTGVVVWMLEHRLNNEFRGRPHQQLGTIFWFSFSTLVFAHKEKMTSNLSKFVVIVWVFVVLVLTTSYTASLTSMLTVQQLQPMYTDIDQLIKRGDYVGYQDGSFVADMLVDMGFDRNKLKNYSTFQDYEDALSNGSSNGGVSAIVEELPYISVLLAQPTSCAKYTMVGPTYKTAGFGFAFAKGSPLVPDVSRAVLQVTEREMNDIRKKWFEKEGICGEQHGTGAIITSSKLRLESFRGLFLIAGVSSTSALAIFLFMLFHENREIITSEVPIRQKLAAIGRSFKEKKDHKASDESKTTGELTDGTNNTPPSSAVGVFHQAGEVFSHDEGLSTTEPGTPLNETADTLEPGTPPHETADTVETSIKR